MTLARRLVLLGLSLLQLARASDNGLARTPQMGWNTWNHYFCGINENIILNAAQAIVKNGLDKLGYNYVLMDDCWQAPARDNATNAPVADPNKFPSGVKDLSDKIHAMGLKFGIYSSAGTMTCGGRFGSLDFEEIDAKTYAEWGVDYLKYDNCYNAGRSGTPLISFERYNNMSLALNATGRPILYSMCNWGEDGPWNWATTMANSWRISGDIMDNFGRFDDRCPCTSMLDCKFAGFHCAMARIVDFAAPLGQKGGHGHWNDLDMLEVGNGGMTYDEYVTHFSMWALLKSPLILGNDITNMSAETLSIITNTAVIALNQDPNGSPANRLVNNPVDGGAISIWAGSLANNAFVVALMNTSPNNQTVTLNMSDVMSDWGVNAETRAYEFFDLWQKDDSGAWGKSIGTVQGNFSADVRPHATRVWRATVGAAKSGLMAPTSNASTTANASTSGASAVQSSWRSAALGALAFSSSYLI